MKREWMICVLTALLLAGCALGVRAPAPTPTPLPTPTPTPRPVIAVLGGAEESMFLNMVQAVSKSAACEFLRLDEGGLARFRPQGRAALILYLDGETPALDALDGRGVHLYAYAAAGQTLPDTLNGLRYDGETAAGMALDEAIGYDNHDTPVRLLGLFTDGESAAADAWRAYVGEGRVLSKGAYYEADAKKDVREWLAGRLGGLYPGMLDGIYCENSALAREAAALLASHARDDVELFCAAADGALLEDMQAGGGPVVRAVGADPAEAGRLCAEQAIVLLYGGTAQRLSIPPSVFAAP